MQNKEYRSAKKTLIIAIAILSIVMFIMPIFAVIMKFQPSNNKTCKQAGASKIEIPDGALDLSGETALNPKNPLIEHNPKNDKGGDWKWRMTNDTYVGYDKFAIKDWKGLQIFMGIVNSENCESSKHYKSFVDKTIYLCANIDCGKAEITIGKKWNLGIMTVFKIFRGNFDGQGFTISNFYTEADNYHYYSTGPNYKVYCFGLFTHVSGEISNLRLYNCHIRGENDSEIYYENVGGSFEREYYTGTIAGYVEKGGVIKNCAIERVFGDSQYLIAGYNMNSSGTANIVNCYINVSNLYDLNESKVEDFILDSNNKYCVVKSEEDGGYSTENKNTAVKGQWVGLINSNSSDGGNNDGQTYWYYGGDYYNDGWLYPRHFITWRDVKIVAGPSASVEGKSEVTIQVPKDGNHVFDSSTATIKIYEQSISSSAVNTCEHAKPMWIGSLSEYKVSYSKPIRTVEIVDSINSKQNKKISKKCCTGLSVNYTPLEKAGADRINIGGYVFTAPNGYYISNISEIETACGTISENKTITIQYEQKKYGISVS